MLRNALNAMGLSSHPRINLDLAANAASDALLEVVSNPATGKAIAAVKLDDERSYYEAIGRSAAAFKRWREIPAPVRGQVVRAIGDEFRKHKQSIGAIITAEVGKITSEAVGEVQETIDIADFAVGLSRQLYGLTMPSERPGHAMREQWLPLGPIGVISAFNFPNAVWAWNAMLAAVCGDTVVWKPSLLAPLTAIATNTIAQRVASSWGHEDLFTLVIGRDEVVGERLIADTRLPLISATGSCRMGKRVGEVVAKRLGRSLLELGGNNAAIVHEDADLDLAARAILFAAVGTCGQRCTTTRRLIVHEKVVDALLSKLVKAYSSVRIGDPGAEGTLVGPLVNARAVEGFSAAIAAARTQGGTVLVGGEKDAPAGLSGYFVQPAIVRAPASNKLPIANEETFAPILYVFTFRDPEEAIEMQNSVAQGLSSAIFTRSAALAERFLSPAGTGSDCGLAYVNMGTSGAEIGGAFGGEKETGGGRESGSDSWKAYMRRQTCSINFSGKIELAQGIRFE
ncbi:MAG: aldehyde dehydrogenase family protein [Phycisphaeraceae bacterium]|nr:aldehyde dehydrogenase family protein [Phycisphaeraceae bacterium]